MIFFLYLISLFHHHLIVIEYSVSFLQPPVRTYRCSCRQSKVLHAGLTRKHIYSQQLLTFSATSLHRLHLGSYQSHRSNDHVLMSIFVLPLLGRLSSDILYLSVAHVLQWLVPLLMLSPPHYHHLSAACGRSAGPHLEQQKNQEGNNSLN